MIRQEGVSTESGTRDIRAESRPGSSQRHRHPSQGHLSLLPDRAAPPERVRAQLAAQRGGADTVFGRPRQPDRWSQDDGSGYPETRSTGTTLPLTHRWRLYEAVRLAQERVENILDEWAAEGRQGLCPVPDEPTPSGWRLWSGASVQCPTLRYAPVGRPVHGSAKGGVGMELVEHQLHV